MKVEILQLSFLAHFLKLAGAAGFISGYTIDDSGDFGRDCDLFSGSVTGKLRYVCGEDANYGAFQS